MKRVLFVVGVFGCAEEKLYVYSDEGTVCLRSTEDPFQPQAVYVSGAPISISFVSMCPAPACSHPQSASCSVTADATGLHVQTVANWLYHHDPGEDCQKNCAFNVATCATEPLSDGTYVFVYGEKSVSITVPSTLPEAPCLEN